MNTFYLPDEISAPVKMLTRSLVLQSLTADGNILPSAPRTILVLQRSAELPALSVESTFDEHPALREHTQFIHIPVGKVMAVQFAEAEGYDEEDVDLQAQRTEFIAWLKTTSDPTVFALRERILPLSDRGNWPVLVLDDARATGETVNDTLPALISAVTGDSFPLEVRLFYDANYSWEATVVDAFGILLSPAEKRVMKELIKGSLDVRRVKIELDSGFYNELISEEELWTITETVERAYNSGHILLSLNNEIAVRLLGLDAQRSAGWWGTERYSSREALEADISENPGQRLMDRLGLNALIRLQETVRQAFSRIR